MTTESQLHMPDLIACVKREIAMRKRVYPRWVDQHRITQAEANYEIACMERVLIELEGRLL